VRRESPERGGDLDFDVIVVGGGGAGMAAAIEAEGAGASVLLVEAAERLGGSTALSGGVFYAAGTSVQAAAGIGGDTPDAMYEYYLSLNQWKVEPSVVRRLCDEAAPTLEWLIGLGVEFPAEKLYVGGVESVARSHKPEGGGASIAASLERELRARRVEVALGNRVQSLLVDGGGVHGVRARGEEATARAVILTTGGFGNSPELLERYYPSAAAAGDWTWSISAATCVGDGLRLALEAGGALGGHDRGLLLRTAGFRKELEIFMPPWLVYVNGAGRRFVCETAAYAVLGEVISDQPGPCYAIFDEESRASCTAADAMLQTYASDHAETSWTAETLDSLADEGRILRGATLEELAARAGLPGETLAGTVGRYNEDCAAGGDSRFYKDPAALRPLVSSPFYAAEIRPAIVCLTSCGPRIDRDAHVLSASELPIPGLYAAGEVAGNVLGELYVGGGNSVAAAIVYGRVAGRSAAAE
jgi:predicted oxidoreductase